MSRLYCEAADEQTNEHAARIAEKSCRWGEIMKKTEYIPANPMAEWPPKELGGRVGFRDQRKMEGGDRADC